MRSLREIALDIERDCNGKQWYVYAEAYVTPMKSLDNLTDTYGADSAESIVLYALSNLTYWRGDTARKCKAELKQHLESYNKARV